MINAIYEGNPKIGLYTLPLLIWHPMQLVFGTFLSPRLLKWVESFPDEEEDDLKLEVVDDEEEKAEEGDGPSDEFGESVEMEAWATTIVPSKKKMNPDRCLTRPSYMY